MKATEITRGDVLRMADLRRGVIVEDVTVVDVEGDTAIVVDPRRPGMSIQVGVEFLARRGETTFSSGWV